MASRLRTPEAVVVGGGVSGCACAAGLASRGISVTVVSSALDGISRPAYGPVVVGGPGGWARIEETLLRLPRVLREVWIDASEAPEDSGRSPMGKGAEGGVVAQGDAYFVVDTRMLSVQVKRALEGVPGVRFRQGLVEGLRLEKNDRAGEGARIVVETAFGEAIEGDVAVIAVGLALGGRVSVGQDVVPGGRYGETPADRLRESLADLGAEFVEAEVDVGPRICGGWERRWADEETAKGRDSVGVGEGLRKCKTVGLRSMVGGAETDGGARRGYVRDDGEVEGTDRGGLIAGCEDAEAVAWGWRDEYPEAPYWTEGLRLGGVMVEAGAKSGGRPRLVPDGVATGEVYVATGEVYVATGEVYGATSQPCPGDSGTSVSEPLGLEDEERCRSDVVAEAVYVGMMASRLGHHVVGMRVAKSGPDGRLQGCGGSAAPIWVAGRAGGAEDYLESLSSGMEVAEGISRWFRTAAARSERGE